MQVLITVSVCWILHANIQQRLSQLQKSSGTSLGTRPCNQKMHTVHAFSRKEQQWKTWFMQYNTRTTKNSSSEKKSPNIQTSHTWIRPTCHAGPHKSLSLDLRDMWGRFMCAYASDLRACLYGQFVFLNVCPGKSNFLLPFNVGLRSFFGSLLHRGCEYLPLWLPLSPLSMSHHCRLKRGQKCLVSQVF